MSASPPAGERRLLYTLAAIQFTHILDFMVLMPLGHQLMQVLRISPQQFALLVSAYTLSAALCGFASALLVDRFDRKSVLLTLYTGFCVSTLLCAAAPNYLSLLAARAFAGGFGGVVGAMVYSIVGDAIPQARRGAATGVVASAFAISAVIGVPLSLFLAHRYGWRTPFLFLGAASALVLIAIWRLVPSLRAHVSPAPVTTPLVQLRTIFSEANHLRAFALTAMLMLAGFTVIPFIAPYMVANVGVTQAQLPYIYLCGGLATAFTSRLAGSMADRHGKHRVFFLLTALSLIPIVLITNLPPVPLSAAVAASALFMVLGNGRFICAMALINSSVEARLRGSFMNFNFSIQQLFAGAASFIAGAIIGHSPGGELTRFGAVGALAFCATVACIPLARRLRLVS